MDVIMKQTLTESINGGRTTQSFVAGGRYLVPDHIGQIWVGRGWATAVPARETSETRGMSETRPSEPVAPVAPVPPVSHPKGKE